jgi:hypothetical protein
MKLATLTMMVAAVALTGCDSSALLSVDPLVTEQDAVFDAGLLGTWAGTGDSDAAACIIRRHGDVGYRISYVHDGSAKEFEALLFRVGETQVLDLAASPNDDFLIAPHMPVRIWLDRGQLRWAYLDSKWLRAQATQLLPHRPVDKRILLAAPTAAIHEFLINHAADEKALGETTTTFVRVP